MDTKKVTFIHLCDTAWNLYFLKKWKTLDKHRENCSECYKNCGILATIK